MVSSKEAAYIGLAAHSAASHRVTDHRGGANGARIRFSPEKDWAANVELGLPLKTLMATVSSSNADYGHVSVSDQIVLAGGAALISLGLKSQIPFCPGRGDAMDGAGSENLEWNLV